jgi:hypothetical protein
MVALADDPSLFHQNDMVSPFKEVDSMSDKDASAVFQATEVHVLDDLVADVSVKCRDRIIHEVDVLVLVECTAKTQSGLLATGKVDASFTDHCLVALPLHQNVALELAELHSVDVLLRIEGHVVANVVTDLLAADPWSLCGVCDGAIDLVLILLGDICDQVIHECDDFLLRKVSVHVLVALVGVVDLFGDGKELAAKRREKTRLA